MSKSLTFQNLLKNRKLLPAETFWNILAFDKESKNKLLSLSLKIIYIYDFRVEISFMPKLKTFWFQKKLHSDIMGFQLQ